MSDVLFFARPLELKMEPIDLAEMLRRLLERWKPRLSQAGVHTAHRRSTPRRASPWPIRARWNRSSST